MRRVTLLEICGQCKTSLSLKHFKTLLSFLVSNLFTLSLEMYAPCCKRRAQGNEVMGKIFANGPSSRPVAATVRRNLELWKLSTADTCAIRQLRDHRREL